MSYKYVKLGNNCKMNTIAITDNNKYIMPQSYVYNIHNTYLNRYPGHDENIISAFLNPIDPENTKSIKSLDEYGPWYDSQKSGYLYPTQYNRPAKCVSCSK
jgi:hypothetical protein